MTNFESITASPEALAEWIAKFARDLAHDYLVPNFPIVNDIGNHATVGDDVLKWLKQESK